jgi:hypothetical protein
MEREVEFHPVVVLSKYFTWAAYMRGQFEKVVPKMKETTPWNDPIFIEMFMFMSFWYATLNTVVEGWRSLELKDAEIEELLKSPHVEMLKRYRHGVSHFQTEYFDKKYMPFMNNPGSMEWVRNLHAAFFRYLNEWFKTHDLHGAPKGSVQRTPSAQ